jgi:hypothetical protein
LKGPFGYGWILEEEKVPGSFYFGAVNGWSQQNFWNFQANQPSSNMWNIPESCANAQPCPNIW